MKFAATELFINLNDNAFLDASGFGAFGKVIGEGMAVVERLYSGYGEMHGGSLGDYLCTRDMAKVWPLSAPPPGVTVYGY